MDGVEARGDPQGQGEDRHGREPRMLRQHAARELHVEDRDGDPARDTGDAASREGRRGADGVSQKAAPRAPGSTPGIEIPPKRLGQVAEYERGVRAPDQESRDPAEDAVEESAGPLGLDPVVLRGSARASRCRLSDPGRDQAALL